MRSLRPKYILAIAFACFSLIGCSVNPGFNQLDLVKRWAMFETKAELEAQLWTTKIGDYEQLAIPVQHEGFMTFYMKDGTEIDFYGWDVTALRNWNQYGKSIQIDRTVDGLEHSLLNGEKVALDCTEYQNVSESYLKQGSIRSARCLEKSSAFWSYTNAVVVDEQGAAIWMLHHVDPDMPPVELRLNGSEESNELSALSWEEIAEKL